MSAFRPWMDHVRVGDVLRDKHGTLRVVRYCRVWVNRHSGNKHLTLYLAIRRCSWTGRAYTCIGTQDIVNRGFMPTGKRKKLTDRISKQMAIDVRYENRFNNKLTCCDVVGVVQ